MAEQNANPPPWRSDMSDGCSGVMDFGYRKACVKHDRGYHYGGGVEDKLARDDEFYSDMCNTPGFWGWIARRGLAAIRYNGVRKLTYSYPPGHPMRKEHPGRVEAFNWLGPGLPRRAKQPTVED